MKSLLLLRHAKSSWNDRSLDDHERPLNERGKSDAPRVGRLLRDEQLIPDVILSSSAKRARRTAAKVAKTARFEGDVEKLRELYDAGEPADVIQVLNRLADGVQRVMVVGHNPCLEEFLHALTNVQESLETAAMAVLDLEIDRWADLSASTHSRLIRIFRPRELWHQG